jgi:hypothetical protein
MGFGRFYGLRGVDEKLSLSLSLSLSLQWCRIQYVGSDEMMQLMTIARRAPLVHRLYALAVVTRFQSWPEFRASPWKTRCWQASSISFDGPGGRRLMNVRR